MVVTLPPELEDLIREMVASGDYRDEGEVISRAILLLEEQDRRAALNAAIEEGEADLREGRFIDIDSDEEFTAFIDAL
jgi:putative addiction module CopG family antidote